MHCNRLLAAAVALALVPACHRGSDGPSSAAIAHSNELTNVAVGEVLGGNHDFAVIQGRLVEALASNSGNHAARLCLGVVNVLAAAEASLMEPGGHLHQALARSGFVNTDASGSMWNLRLEAENHGQGRIKDTTPTMDEVVDYVRVHLRPMLDGLVAVLDGVPRDFDLVIPAAQGGMLLQWLAPGQPIDLRLDYGDAQLAAAVVRGVLVAFDLLGTLDWDNLAPNDFDDDEHPGLDVLELLRTNYPNLGHIARPDLLALARQHLRQGWQNYENAITFLREEDATRQDHGVFTLGRDRFATPVALQQFLAAETRLRALGRRLVDALDRDVVVRFDTDPLTGNALPEAEQAEVNLFRFFVGVDPRDLYFKTVVDPMSLRRAFGVTSLAELTDRMATFADVLPSIGGMRPGIGDLQSLLYELRVDAPPVSTKTIDGDFADWQAGAVQVAAAPTAWIAHPAPDLGRLYASVDATALYVRLDRDLTPFLTATGDRYAIRYAGQGGEAEVRFTPGAGHESWCSQGALPTWAHNGQGIEIRFPIQAGAGDWAQLQVLVEADNASYAFTSDRDKIFVKVR